MLHDIVNILILVLFGIAVNIAIFAVWKYRVANDLHMDRHKKEYAGALPEHIWQTALGTAFVLVGAIVLLLQTDGLTVAHGILGVGFLLVALGMHKLLNFENHRINTLSGEVQVTEKTVEKV